MTNEQAAAFIQAQTALMNAEAERMKAANYEREMQGLSHAYGQEQWKDFIDEWQHVLGHNAVIELFRSVA